MSLSPDALTPAALEFLRERHLATFTTLRRDGTPHVVPVGFTWDDDAQVARVMTSRTSTKAGNAQRGTRAALCQVDGWRWITLEGATQLVTDQDAVADAMRRYAVRYREPRVNPERVVLEVFVDRVLGLVDRAKP